MEDEGSVIGESEGENKRGVAIPDGVHLVAPALFFGFGVEEFKRDIRVAEKVARFAVAENNADHLGGVEHTGDALDAEVLLGGLEKLVKSARGFDDQADAEIALCGFGGKAGLDLLDGAMVGAEDVGDDGRVGEIDITDQVVNFFSKECGVIFGGEVLFDGTDALAEALREGGLCELKGFVRSTQVDLGLFEGLCCIVVRGPATDLSEIISAMVGVLGGLGVLDHLFKKGALCGGCEGGDILRSGGSGKRPEQGCDEQRYPKKGWFSLHDRLLWGEGVV